MNNIRPLKGINFSIILIVIAGFLLIAALSSAKFKYSEAEAKKLIGDRGNNVIVAFRDNNMSVLARYVHPHKGVRFSPNPLIGNDDVVFTGANIQGVFKDKKKYNWGVDVTSLEPINKTFNEYCQEFIYDRDYASVKDIGYNRVVRETDMVSNISEYYPDAIVIEYYFSGSVAQESSDWTRLRLVFEEFSDEWFLIGVVHEQWTI